MRLGGQFGWLWAAYSVSTVGTWLGFGAFPLIAVLVLDAGPTAVSVLAAAGPAVGAVVAVPLGPWVEARRKRSVMVGMDLVRVAALASVPVAFAFDRLTFAHLLVVSVITAAADIAFRAASGAYLKALLPPEKLLVANSRFEATTWTATLLGPPLGTAALSLLGPVTTVLADAVSYLLSAAGLRAIGRDAPPAPAAGKRVGNLVDGWRHILTHPVLRPLLFHSLLVNALIMATVPLMVVLMLGDLGFSPWQYGLAFGLPCVGGLIGARLAHPLVTRFGRHRVLLVAGWLRVCWPIGLAFVQPGTGGLALVIAVQFALVTCMGVFNPVFATSRLDHTPPDRIARTLTAWSVTNHTTTATVTAFWGLLAATTSPRIAIGAAGLLVLATPLLLPRRAATPLVDAGRRDRVTPGWVRRVRPRSW